MTGKPELLVTASLTSKVPEGASGAPRDYDAPGRISFLAMRVSCFCLSVALRLTLESSPMATIHDLTKYLGQPDGPLAAVVEMFPDMVFVVDREERILHINTLAARSLGGKPEHFIGRRQSTLFGPQLGERHSQFIQQVFRTGEIVVTETHQELHDAQIWIDARLVPLKTTGGEVGAVVGIIRDVSVRVRAQESLAVREAYLRAMLDNFPFLVWLKDIDGRFLAVNQTFARSCGRERAADVVGLTDFDVWPRELAQRYVDDDLSVMATRQQKDVEEPIFIAGRLPLVRNLQDSGARPTG